MIRPAVLTCALLMLAACDKAKPRHLPVDSMALTPPPPGDIVAPRGGLSTGLPQLEPAPAFAFDRIGLAPDPMTRQPALTSAAPPFVIQGFAYDAAARLPGKGVDVVIDDRVFGTLYGKARPDVATYAKVPGLVPVGFITTLPPDALTVGPHMASVRVIAADGKGYYQSRKIAFEVR